MRLIVGSDAQDVSYISELLKLRMSLIIARKTLTAHELPR